MPNEKSCEDVFSKWNKNWTFMQSSANTQTAHILQAHLSGRTNAPNAVYFKKSKPLANSLPECDE